MSTDNVDKKYFRTQKEIMKQKSLLFNFSFRLSFFTALFLIVSGLYAQEIPELVFRNPVLESGTALQNGAKYRFSQAADGIDAIVEIRRRSASNVVINNIDLTSFGWDKAFQPELGIPGTVAPYQNWWVEFEVSFVKAGTSKREKVDKFDITSLDVDGDNVSIQEYVIMEKPKSITYSTISSLINNAADNEVECGACGESSTLISCTNCLGTGLLGLCGNCKGTGKVHATCDHAWDGETNHNIQGPIQNYLNIDTLGTAVMATYHYEDKDKIRMKIGAKSNAKSSTAGMRLNSMWYRSFNLASFGLLPVKLTNFNARCNKQNVALSWSTEEETTFSHFVIEKSFNGIDFKEAAIVVANDNGAPRKEYSYNDDLESNNKGVIYYRLKMVDVNKQSQKSAIRVIKTGDELTAVNVQAYPNPVVNELRITVPSAWQNKQVTYDLYSLNGKIVKHVVSNNANQTEVLSTTHLNPGMYIVKVSSGNETAVKQVLKGSSANNIH